MPKEHQSSPELHDESSFPTEPTRVGEFMGDAQPDKVFPPRGQMPEAKSQDKRWEEHETDAAGREIERIKEELALHPDDPGLLDELKKAEAIAVQIAKEKYIPTERDQPKHPRT